MTIEASASKQHSRVKNARNDVLTGGIIVAAILMFVGTGSQIMSNAVDALTGVGGGADRTLTVALLLNIALILFGWRRYRDLSNEIVERTEAEQRAQVLASRDPLTGFLNRRALSDEGTALLTRTTKRQKTLAVLMLDLDHFKNVNDVHGHAVGDALLKSVSAEVGALVPPSSMTARLGGDEFACAFAYDAGNPEVVERVAQAIVARLGESLGLPVTAEGIEDPAIEERLRQLGCHKGQGWMYGRPLPLAGVRTLLAERNLLNYARLPEPDVAVAPDVDTGDLDLRRTA